ncbi:hypothetical protein C0Q70_15555 [Pomacea canaliculata]|uniref:Uncharacterized protein n=1 Tax=Pomacea canaliculata TaxID=400727 RepID=A0A2T7NV53_POMCA|nr:hypothetical protein C0Q70_15555 [Pomacea canaliculata]
MAGLPCDRPPSDVTELPVQFPPPAFVQLHRPASRHWILPPPPHSLCCMRFLHGDAKAHPGPSIMDRWSQLAPGLLLPRGQRPLPAASTPPSLPTHTATPVPSTSLSQDDRRSMVGRSFFICNPIPDSAPQALRVRTHSREICNQPSSSPPSPSPSPPNPPSLSSDCVSGCMARVGVFFPRRSLTEIEGLVQRWRCNRRL